MIIASIPHPADRTTRLAVQVLDVYTSSSRTRALVRALPVGGRQIEPFTVPSAGGPFNTSSAIVSADALADVRIVNRPPRYASLESTCKLALPQMVAH